MKLSTVSTAADLLQRSRVSRELEATVARLQEEVVTGRHADRSKAIGHDVANVEAIRQDITRAEAFQVSNGQVGARLDLTQEMLGSLIDGNNGMIDQLVTARSAADVRGSTAHYASTRLDEIASTLNTRLGGVGLFSGLNTGSVPFPDDQLGHDGPARSSVRDAFEVAFGFPPSSDQVSTIDPTDMAAFLDGPFSDIFSPNSWTSLWTVATDSETAALVTEDVTVTSGVTAAGDAYRTMVQASVMVADLGLAQMSSGTAELVLDRATHLNSDATAEILNDQGRMAVAQEEVQISSDRLSTRLDVFQASVARLEGVDVYQRSGELVDAMTQLDISYELTARLQSLTLLNRI